MQVAIRISDEPDLQERADQSKQPRPPMRLLVLAQATRFRE